MTEEKRAEILHDHYKDTFSNQKDYIKKRNTYTLICLAIIASFAFQISNPTLSDVITNELIKKSIGEVSINFNYINNILCFGLFWIILMYFQITLIIEKYYKYIEDIETDLTSLISPSSISRESKTYNDNYPWLSSVAHRIYTILFPFLLLFIIAAKWISEKNAYIDSWHSIHFWIDTIFLFSACLITILYLINIHFNDFKK